MLTSDETSTQYFNSLRWKGKRLCPRCMYNEQYSLKSNRYGCKKCRYNFSEFTGTYLGKLRIKPSLITHMLYLFVAEQSAYKMSKDLKCHISTIERTFKVFRQAINDKSLQNLQKELPLFRQLGIDERTLDIHRKDYYLDYKKDIDGKEYIIFAIYEMNGVMITFPISEIKNEISDKLKNQLKKKKSNGSEIEDEVPNIWKQVDNKEEFNFNTSGSFYKKNDHIAYAMLDIKGSKENNKVVVSDDIESGRGENIYIGLDGFWSYIEKWLYHYRGIPKQYFHLYLKEIEFRFNNRNKDMFLELSKLLVKPLPQLFRQYIKT